MAEFEASEKKSLMNLSGLLTQLAISIPLGIAATLLFSVLRPKHKAVYAKRLKYADEDRKPPPLNDGLFSWLGPLFRVKSAELIDKIGLDAVIFLRFLTFSCWFFGVMGLLLVGILIPINLSSYNEANPNKTPGFRLESISIIAARNIPNRFWAHVVMTWVFSLTVYAATTWFWVSLIRLRQGYFASPEYQNSLHGRSVMLINLPSSMRTEEGLIDLLKKHKIYHKDCKASLARDLGTLPALLENHKKSIETMEVCINDYLSNPNFRQMARPTHRTNLIGGTGVVDSFNFYEKNIFQLEEEIHAEREKAREFKPSNLGFITFPKVKHAHAAVRVLRKKAGFASVRTEKAPLVNDLIWANAEQSEVLRKNREWTGFLIYLAFLFLGLTGMTILSAVLNLNRLRNTSVALDRLATASPMLFTFLASSVSPLLMVLFFLFMLMFFRYISLYQGTYTETNLRTDIFRKYFAFLFFNDIVFILIGVFTAYYTALNSKNLNNIVTQFSKSDTILSEMATTLIDISTFWISYTTIKGIEVLVQLAQLVNLLRMFIRRYLARNNTPRERNKMLRPPDFPYAEMYAVHLFLFSVGITYSIISPLIMPFTFLNFGLAYLVYKYQLMYVYTTKVETAGAIWPVMYNRVMFVLGFFQVLMLGAANISFVSLATNKFALSNISTLQAIVLLPLPFVTILVRWINVKSFSGRFKYVESSLKINSINPEDALGDSVGGTGDDTEMRYTHSTLHRRLMKVLVTKEVAKYANEFYKGPIAVESEALQTGVSRFSTIRRHWSVAPDTEVEAITSTSNAGISAQAIIEEEGEEEEEGNELLEYEEEEDPKPATLKVVNV